ncbi:MAG: DUF6516 family protein [Candidatus Bathyarchaeota archaeon]|nr:DUF6516 family protein [Candidatus Bathyarchaeota archaeon]
MDVEALLSAMRETALDGYPDIVTDATIHRKPSGTIEKLRLLLVDDTFLDVWLSPSGRYSYHWERRGVNGTIYRYDNAPHKRGGKRAFPHFHDGSEENVAERRLVEDPLMAFESILGVVRTKIRVGKQR